MKERIFHSSMLRVVRDVTVTCEGCQKRKIQGMHVKQLVLKVDAREPFELVVIDRVLSEKCERERENGPG